MAPTPPFATTDDLEAGWRSLSAEELARATVLLTRASQLILDEDRNGILDDLTAPTDTMVRVTCEIVRRAMSTPVDQPLMTQVQSTTGPFTMGGTYANPGGDMFLSRAERRQLGFNRLSAGSVDLWDGAYA